MNEDEEGEGDRELYYDFESSDENDEVEEEREFQTAAASYWRKTVVPCCPIVFII